MVGRSLAGVACVAIALFGATAPVGAQLLARPHLDWKTLETEHYTIHFPTPLEPWTRSMAGRIESVHDEVARVVGSRPRARVTVIVDDWANVAAGFAIPVLDTPLLYLFPTPPSPSSGIGHHRDWAELLAIHEIAHLAHLTRPSRNPRQRLLWKLLPVRVGPIARRSPRWVTEGYATYIEGQLSGSGRPHGVLRAALLRQRALEGRLPSYAELNGDRSYQGGAMPYLAGSAFIEWLVARRGDESLVHLWRRMTARRDRGFAEAFAGVYGGTPADLYGRFTTELTGRALAVEDTLASAGLITGDTVQQRNWSTGAPSLSKDGKHIAIALGVRDRAPRLVIWPTEDEPESDKVREARERARRRDPEDVPAIEWRPRAKRALATLFPVAGRPHVEPRFFADGERVLVARAEPLSDGAMRPDLFVWHWRTGRLRRVTHHAALHDADPSPDGRHATAVQCLQGICSLVAVDLANGGVRTLAAGSTARTFYRPRYSRDGTRIIVSVKDGDSWSLHLADAAIGQLRRVPVRDGVSVYDAEFSSDSAIVAVSERGGIANLARIDLVTGVATPLTRVTGAAFAPEPNRADGSVFFLELHAEGLNLNRLSASVTARPLIIPDSTLAPAMPMPAASADTFLVQPLATARAYGLGPRRYRVLPGGAVGAGGSHVSGMLLGTDPVGRLTWIAQGAYGGDAGWRGASLAVAYRRSRPSVGVEIFGVRHRPSLEENGRFASTVLDARYAGGALTVGQTVYRSRGMNRLRAGLSYSRLDGFTYDDAARRFAFVELDTRTELFRRDRWGATVDASLHGALGRTDHPGGDDWWRVVATGSAEVRAGPRALLASATVARAEESSPEFELPVVGGVAVPLIDPSLLSQRIAMPALPTALLGGDHLVIARAELTGGLFSPYYWIAKARGGTRWHRVLGSESRLEIPLVPWLRLPAMSAIAGVGYSLDEPFRKRTRGYLSLTFRP